MAQVERITHHTLGSRAEIRITASSASDLQQAIETLYIEYPKNPYDSSHVIIDGDEHVAYFFHWGAD
jgi:hypothetical protein